MSSLGKLLYVLGSSEVARGTSRPRGIGELGSRAMLALMILVLSIFSLATRAAAQARDARPTAEEREAWRQKIIHTRPPKKGCFEAKYPEAAWREVACNKPSRKLYPPKRRGGIRVDNIVGGAGPDFSAKLDTDFITTAEGSFDSTANVTSECNVACPPDAGGTPVCPTNPSCSGEPANDYSLQLNSKPFTTTACSGSNTGECQGWEQFVYDSTSGTGSIQYWLENYATAGNQCPTPRSASCTAGFASSDGWCPFQFTPTGNVYCVVNGANATAVPSGTTLPFPASLLDQLKVEGIAGSTSADDQITVTTNGTPETVNGGNFFTDLAKTWQEVEFNVLGDGDSSQAVFNSGATIQVRTSVDSKTSEIPTCDGEGFTGESNNLTLVDLMPPVAHTGTPSLVFKESNASGSTQTGCTGSVSVGDTHITSFDGLYYDFQASGDFVLMEDADIAVHTRQESGAPTWPNAAVNKAIAVKMGNVRVNFYVEPQQHILIDGRSAEVADRKTEVLAGGIQVARHGDTYKVSNESGDSVQVTLHDPSGSYTKWIDVSVQLGFAGRPNVRGLMGSPKGNAHELATAEGKILKEPLAFNDLYHEYADSWRVKSGDSLFAEVSTIKPGIPEKPFFVEHLDPAVAARARATCTAAGVTEPQLLNSCILDNAVLGHEAAARVFVKMVPPKHVMKPEAR